MSKCQSYLDYLPLSHLPCINADLQGMQEQLDSENRIDTAPTVARVLCTNINMNSWRLHLIDGPI